MPVIRRAGAVLVAAVVLALSVPVSAQTPALAPAASADAYALDVDATLTPLDIEVDEGPYARAAQEFPPQAAALDEADMLSTGQIPAGGALVENIGVLSSIAGANGQPLAAASSQAVDVRLISQAGVPLITADILRAVSTTDCLTAPSSAGTEFVNLRVGPAQDPINNPAPNTEVGAPIFNPLGLRVIVNEQHPTADGRGLVVNAIHIYNVADPEIPGLFVGDVIVSHAMSTVNCPNGAPTTGGNNPIFIVKNADKASAKRGDTVTYTATVQNKATEPCIVNQLIDHLPQAFEYVSTAGAAGTVAETEARPGGGTDVIIKPEGVTIPAGGSLTQTYVVKVRDDAAPGTYFNNVEILCSNLGNWVKGLDAPVRVVTETPPPPRLPQCSDKKDNDGDGKIDFPNDPGCSSPQDDDERDTMPRTGLPSVLALAAVAVAGGGLLLRRMLNARP